MKIKPSKDPGNVVVEIGPNDEKILAENPVGVREVKRLFKIKRILVPTDFSDCSKKALRYAIPFAKQFDAEVTLVHVVQINISGNEYGSFDYPLLEKELTESRGKLLKNMVKDEIGETVPADGLLLVGHPVREVVAAAKKLEADLIIVSTHGHTGLKHILLGSTAENIVRHAPCPVLVVRESEHEFI